MDRRRLPAVDLLGYSGEVNMPPLPTRDGCTFLIGKELTEVTFGKSHTELRFDGGARINIGGDVEHRVQTDMLGRAVPEKAPLPSLLHLVGMTVRQVGADGESLLLAFDDGHEVRLFADGGDARFEIVARG
jgi:hypothetical protein